MSCLSVLSRLGCVRSCPSAVVPSDASNGIRSIASLIKESKLVWLLTRDSSSAWVLYPVVMQFVDDYARRSAPAEVCKDELRHLGR